MNRFLDTYTSLTGMTYRFDQFGQNINATKLKKTLLRVGKRDTLLEIKFYEHESKRWTFWSLTDATGLTGFAYRSDWSSQNF
jgi:hypothetical protein